MQARLVPLPCPYFVSEAASLAEPFSLAQNQLRRRGIRILPRSALASLLLRKASRSVPSYSPKANLAMYNGEALLHVRGKGTGLLSSRKPRHDIYFLRLWDLAIC